MKGVCWHFIHRLEADRNESYCTPGLYILSPWYSVWVPSSCSGYVFLLHLNPIGNALKDMPRVCPVDDYKPGKLTVKVSHPICQCSLKWTGGSQVTKPLGNNNRAQPYLSPA